MEESLWYDDMKILAVTTYNNKLYKEYAHRFESTYNWEFPYTYIIFCIRQFSIFFILSMGYFNNV